MKRKNIITFFVTLLLVEATTKAAVIPGRWEKVAAEKPGSNFIVTMMTGELFECTFTSLSTDTLTVSTPDGIEREYRKADVARIVTADQRMGSLANGVGIGALAGGIPSGILAILAVADCRDCGAEAAAFVALWTGIGAAIGLAIDAGTKETINLYEAPQKPTKP